MAWPAIIAAVGAAVSIYGQYQAGMDAADAADINARRAKENAEAAKIQARENARRIRISGTKDIGAMQAAAGASGLGPGSSVDAIAEAIGAVETDAMTVEKGGDLDYKKYLSSAKDYETLASGYRASGALGALGSGLSGGANYYEKYIK